MSHKNKRKAIRNNTSKRTKMLRRQNHKAEPAEQMEVSNIILKKYNLLVLLLNFDKYWSPYSLSDGGLYKEVVKLEGEKIVRVFYEIYGESLKAEVTSDGEVITQNDMHRKFLFIKSLKQWCNSDDLFPSLLPKDSIQNRNKNLFQFELNGFEEFLCNELQLQQPISCKTAVFESMFHRNVLRWAAQLPDEVISKVDDDYINRMGQSDTLVVVGDIRRSQDLMTYGTDPVVYRDKIIEFMTKTREILKRNCGLYDRFTGDGFIAYFNKYMCEQEGKDYYEMMINSCTEIMKFSNPFFKDWCRLLRKIPEKEIGLSIGVDSGIVSFKDLDHQLFAIGDACVWATRMNAAGEKGDVVLNNIPFQQLCSALNSDNCTQFASGTKSGELFSAFRVQVENVHYTSPQRESRENSVENAIN